MAIEVWISFSFMEFGQAGRVARYRFLTIDILLNVQFSKSTYQIRNYNPFGFLPGFQQTNSSALSFLMG
jgi:hypothetical protein